MYLKKLHKQIIHSDLGADNFLVLNGEIHAVIDFTLDIKNELYSLAHFLYWNYMWSAEKLTKRDINQYFNNYYSSENLKSTIKDFYLLLLMATSFRFLGPMFEIFCSEVPDYTYEYLVAHR